MKPIMRPMNKRGKIYVMFVCAFMLLALIFAYLELVKYYRTNDVLGADKNIGEKQSFILDAVDEGERVNSYARQVALLAARDASNTPTCSDRYLDTVLIGEHGCEDAILGQYMASMNTYLAAYPSGSLTGIDWSEPALIGRKVTLHGEKNIPIGPITAVASAALSDGSGSFTQQPVDGMTITSLFGNRDTGIQDASKNHPGLDISVGGSLQTPIRSITKGEARFFPAGEYSYVQVKNSDIIIEYMHTKPAPGISSTTWTPVEQGALIAYPAPFPAGGVHLHLQVRVPEIDGATAKRLWPKNSADRNTQTSGKSYAVITRDEKSAYLDPVCFFDRTVITQALERGRKNTPDVFEACPQYERAFGLSSKFPKAVDPSALDPATSTAGAAEGAEANTPTASSDTQNVEFDITKTPVRVQATYKRLQEQAGLLDRIKASAEKHDVPAELVLAIISQESEGIPTAVSETGCTGLGQFCIGTARGNEYSAIFTKLTACECSGSDCRNQNTRACSPANDDRFDPYKSADAIPIRLRQALNYYKEYEQGFAFAIGSYNAGEGTMKKGIDATGKGKQASWPEVKAAMQRLPDDVISRGKKCELLGGTNIGCKSDEGYVDKVLAYYRSLGGVTFAGTSFTTQTLGYYDVRIRTEATVEEGFATVLSRIHDTIDGCTTNTCIMSAVAGMTKPDWMEIVVEPLGDLAGTCMTPAEEAQAYVANQFESCKNSPDNTCSCAFAGNIDASFSISPSELQIEKINGNNIREADRPTPLPGVAYELQGDSEHTSEPKIIWARSNPNEPVTSVWESRKKDAANEGTLKLQRSSSPIIELSQFILAPDPDMRFTAMYKDTDTLAFVREPTQACVMAPRPVAFCARRKDNHNDHVVFYVDMAAHSKPTADITMGVPQVTQGITLGFNQQTFGGSARITFSTTNTEPLPYVHAVVEKTSDGPVLGSEVVFEDYLEAKVISPDAIGVEQIAQDAVPFGHGHAITYGNTYELVVPYEPGSTIKVSLLDENLRETAPSEISIS